MRMQWWCNDDIHEEAWSASLIAREHVAVAVGNPSGVYQYLVSFPTISSLSLLFFFRDIQSVAIVISIPHADDGDGLDDQMLIRMIIIFTHYPGELGTLRPPCQSIQVHLIKNEREAGMMMPLQPVWFFGEQLVVLPNHCWTVFWIKLPEWSRMDDGVDQVYHHGDHQDPCHG